MHAPTAAATARDRGHVGCLQSHPCGREDDVGIGEHEPDGVARADVATVEATAPAPVPVKDAS